MTERPTDSSRHSGRHRRSGAVLDSYGLSRAAGVLPAVAARASRHSLGFVRTALSYRPELNGVRRGIAGLGAAAVLSLSLMGAAPTTGYAEAPHASQDAPASASEKPADEKRPRQHTVPEVKPEPNNAKKKEKPKPVAGLDATQMDNAVKVVRIGQRMNIPERGQAVALVTAMQETKMKNLASHAVPESQNYDHDGLGSDHDSVGLFQQRPSMGWGSVAECMDVDYSTSTFYKRLKTVDNWQDMPLADAAQAVQASAFPDAYTQWEDVAYAVIEEVN